MKDIKVSLFASAVRPHLWKEFLDSLKDNDLKYEVVFAGNASPADIIPIMKTHPEFVYIDTANIKPSQCYEIARRACEGELIGWVADDCAFTPHFLDKIYDYWIKINDSKAIIAAKTNENGTNNDLNDHRFFERNVNTPQMAPLGFMSREYLEKLGGIDQRYVAGQYENNFVMMALADGGRVYKYEEVCVNIEHQKKHGDKTKFWSGYIEDRKVLEGSWVIGGWKPMPTPFLGLLPTQKTQNAFWYYPIINNEVTLVRQDLFVPFEDKDILTVSQNSKGIWE